MTALQKDPAFEKYSIDELAKIAYYRGILIEREKDAPADIREEAIANFDAAMKSPERVKELPEPELKIAEREQTKERKRDTAEQSL